MHIWAGKVCDYVCFSKPLYAFAGALSTLVKFVYRESWFFGEYFRWQINDSRFFEIVKCCDVHIGCFSSTASMNAFKMLISKKLSVVSKTANISFIRSSFCLYK